MLIWIAVSNFHQPKRNKSHPNMSKSVISPSRSSCFFADFPPPFPLTVLGLKNLELTQQVKHAGEIKLEITGVILGNPFFQRAIPNFWKMILCPALLRWRMSGMALSSCFHKYSARCSFKTLGVIIPLGKMGQSMAEDFWGEVFPQNYDLMRKNGRLNTEYNT